MTRPCAGLACVLLMASPVWAQPAQPTFRAEVSLVEIAVVVTDDEGRPVDGLTSADFDVREDGQTRRIVSLRRVAPPSADEEPRALPIPDARLEHVATNRGLADAPAFVVLIDDMNIEPVDAHRAIRASLGLVRSVPSHALLSVVTTSGAGGSLLTLTPPSADHEATIRAVRGRYLLDGAAGGPADLATTPSSVDAPCGVGSHAMNSPDCGDPTRPARRAARVQAVGRLLAKAGSRRKVLFWLTVDAGISPLDPQGNRKAQFAALQAVLGGDVTVYAVDPRENQGLSPGTPFSRVRPTGGRMRVGPGNSTFMGADGSSLALDADDMVGVPLSQLTRETGGRWIQSANNLETMLPAIVKQNLSTYLLAYESSVSTTPGRHAMDVRVRRRGMKVSARRAYVVSPSTATPEVTAPSEDTVTAFLADLVTRPVPLGTLDLRVHAAPAFATSGPAPVLLTLAVDPASAADTSAVEALVLTIDSEGVVSPARRFTLTRPTDTAAAWEAHVVVPVAAGTHQLRVAATTPDRQHTGIVVHVFDVRRPGPSLELGVPVVLRRGESGLRSTLVREVTAGEAFVLQTEVAGAPDAVARATVDVSIFTASGQHVRDETASLGSTASAGVVRAAFGLDTATLTPGDYLVTLSARVDATQTPPHVVRVRVVRR